MHAELKRTIRRIDSAGTTLRCSHPKPVGMNRELPCPTGVRGLARSLCFKRSFAGVGRALVRRGTAG